MKLNILGKQSAVGNKQSNFFTYAIRKIILVVIGILIAVSINNWNKNRKKNNELKQILVQVKEDLKTDLVKIDKVFEFYENKKSIFKKVLKSEYTIEDYIQNPNIAFVIFGYPELAINQRGISLFEDFKGDFEIEKEILAQELIVFYKQQLLEINVDDQLPFKD